jgi:hypothetical protein
VLDSFIVQKLAANAVVIVFDLGLIVEDDSDYTIRQIDEDDSCDDEIKSMVDEVGLRQAACDGQKFVYRT